MKFKASFLGTPPAPPLPSKAPKKWKPVIPSRPQTRCRLILDVLPNQDAQSAKIFLPFRSSQQFWSNLLNLLKPRSEIGGCVTVDARFSASLNSWTFSLGAGQRVALLSAPPSSLASGLLDCLDSICDEAVVADASFQENLAVDLLRERQDFLLEVRLWKAIPYELLLSPSSSKPRSKWDPVSEHSALRVSPKTTLTFPTSKPLPVGSTVHVISGPRWQSSAVLFWTASWSPGNIVIGDTHDSVYTSMVRFNVNPDLNKAIDDAFGYGPMEGKEDTFIWSN